MRWSSRSGSTYRPVHADLVRYSQRRTQREEGYSSTRHVDDHRDSSQALTNHRPICLEDRSLVRILHMTQARTARKLPTARKAKAAVRFQSHTRTAVPDHEDAPQPLALADEIYRQSVSPSESTIRSALTKAARERKESP